MEILKRKATYQSLIARYEAELGRAGHVSHGHFEQHHQSLEAAAMEIIAFEQATMIPDAKRVIEREKEFRDRVATFRKLVDRFTILNAQARELVDGLVAGTVAPEQLEMRSKLVEDKSISLRIAKEALATLEGLLEAVLKEKATLTKSALADASISDPFGKFERIDLERIFDMERNFNAATSSIVQASQPEVASK